MMQPATALVSVQYHWVMKGTNKLQTASTAAQRDQNMDDHNRLLILSSARKSNLLHHSNYQVKDQLVAYFCLCWGICIT